MKNTNAREELLGLLKSKAKIKCATISTSSWEEEIPSIVLKLNYSEDDYIKFLKKLDFMYDSGYGGQELYGTIWLEDGTWCTRGEYDGSEWWEYNKLPDIPKELLN